MHLETPYFVDSKRFPTPRNTESAERCDTVDATIRMVQDLIKSEATDILVVRANDGAYQIIRGDLVFDSQNDPLSLHSFHLLK